MGARQVHAFHSMVAERQSTIAALWNTWLWAGQVWGRAVLQSSNRERVLKRCSQRARNTHGTESRRGDDATHATSNWVNVFEAAVLDVQSEGPTVEPKNMHGLAPPREEQFVSRATGKVCSVPRKVIVVLLQWDSA